MIYETNLNVIGNNPDQRGILLPLLVLLGARGGTVAVWFAPDKRLQTETHLAQTVKILEERVMNLETIYTSLPDAAKPLSPSSIRED